MADRKYSVDDILSEYDAGSGDGVKSAPGKTDINDIVNGNEAYIATTVHSSTTTDDDAASQSKAATVSGLNSEDDFSRKYAKLTSVVTELRENDVQEAYASKTKTNRSFSEKIEQTDIYGVNGEDVYKEEKFAEAKTENIFSESYVQDAVRHKTPDDPFEKYSSILFQDEDKNNDSENALAFESSDKSMNLEDILNEYASPKKKTVKNEHTLHKSITEFFTKLIPKVDNEDDGITGNTELLDGMLKAKKERISRTQHIAPIERKSISDIDLKLDDKILPDTAQLSVDNEINEQEKIKALRERRSKKIKDFVLIGDEEDIDEEDLSDSEPVVIDDFESFNDAPSIAHDIAQLKGSLILRLLVLVICLAASLYISVANDTKVLPIMDILDKRSQTNTYLFVNAILGLVSAFSSYTVISCGLSKLLSFKADCDSLCAVSSVASIVSTMIMFANGNLVRGSYVHIYVSVAIASLVFNTLGKLFIVRRTQQSFKFISGSSEKYAVFPVTDEETAQNFTRGALSDFPSLAAMKKTEFISEFLKTSYSSDITDRFCRIFTPVTIVAAVIIGIITGLLGREEHGSSSIYIGISVFVGVVSICAGFSMMLIVNLPMLRASKKNAELQGVVLGYDAIEEFADTNSILIDAEQIFPQGSVKLAAIKVFSDTRIDEAIVEAASLSTQAGSILKNMFYDIIAGKTEMLNPVESYIFEDSMGLCGWINNKRVLLGNRELMVNHSIEGMPPITKEREYTENGRCAVYLSISGELSAMFLVEITPTMEVRQAFQDLQKNDIYIMIRSVDSLVSINRLSELFDISPEYLKLIPFRMHEQFNEVTSYQVKQKATLSCSGRFAAFSSLILSCRRMKKTINIGIGLQAVSMLLGILIFLVMVIIGDFQSLFASMLVMYNAVFTAVLTAFQLVRRN